MDQHYLFASHHQQNFLMLSTPFFHFYFRNYLRDHLQNHLDKNMMLNCIEDQNQPREHDYFVLPVLLQYLLPMLFCLLHPYGYKA